MPRSYFKLKIGDLAHALDNLPLTYDERRDAEGAIQKAWNIVDGAWSRAMESDESLQSVGMWPYCQKKAEGAT